MGLISHLTSRPAFQAVVKTDIPHPFVVSNRKVIANIHDFSREQLLCSNASQSCYDRMLEIPQQVREFFVHRYADTRMFIRAFSSMFGETTLNEIGRRTHEIGRFREVMEDPQVTGQRANRRFERLTSQTKDLFFYTDASYLMQFQNETDVAKSGAMRLEIVRECNQAISFQRTLTIVNTLFRFFTGRTEAQSTHSGATEVPSPDWNDIWTRFFRRERMPEPVDGGPRGGAVSTVTTPGVDLNIPDTVLYDKDSIPANIKTKADQIDELSSRFTGTIPLEYKDPAMLEFMRIPVFDASHPVVQSRLPALRTALGSGSSVDLSSHRNARHLQDKDSLEAQIAAGTSWAPAKCQICRHPADGGIRRANLRIDTGLQDEILRYLRAHVPASP